MLGLHACVSHPRPNSGPVRDHIFQKCQLKPAGEPADVHDRQKAGGHYAKKKIVETEDEGWIMPRQST